MSELLSDEPAALNLDTTALVALVSELCNATDDVLHALRRGSGPLAIQVAFAFTLLAGGWTLRGGRPPSLATATLRRLRMRLIIPSKKTSSASSAGFGRFGLCGSAALRCVSHKDARLHGAALHRPVSERSVASSAQQEADCVWYCSSCLRRNP